MFVYVSLLTHDTADKNDCSGQKTAPPGGGEKLDHSASLEIQRLCNTRHKQSMAAAGRPAPPTVAEGMILKKRPKNQEELAAMSAEVAASVEVVVLAQAECRRAFQQRVGR